MSDSLRNVAIIAHVDHGKTTLVDGLLYQCGMFRDAELDKLAGGQHGLVMDSNDLERERGITIFSKNCALRYRSRSGKQYKINLVDTPGHADFGGEVERVLKMADGALLLVDAFEGPMPQTRFVLEKALEHGLRPLVVVNKIDRPDARPDDVVNEVFDLLVELDADDAALDFPVVFSSARDGWASRDSKTVGESLEAIFEAIVEHVPPPRACGIGDSSDSGVADADGSVGDPLAAPVQMLVTTLDWSDYVGRIAIGRLFAGRLHAGQEVTVIDRAGNHTLQRALKLLSFDGLSRREVDRVEAGDICAVVGLSAIDIGNTIADRDRPAALPTIHVDEPTLHMTLQVNDSPVAGREGQYVTSRQLRERLHKELGSNVALCVSPGQTPEHFHVSGRGLMHLGILMENMRREGFEFAAGKPRVIFREVEGKAHEPIERLVVDCPVDCQSSVMSLVGDRRAELVRMAPKPGASGFMHMEFTVPARGLVGMRGRMMTATQGKAIMHHNFYRYEKMRGEIVQRHNGVMIASEAGQVTAYALDALFDRGDFFVSPGDQVYQGQIVGEHNRESDLVVNVTRGKKLSNVRAAGKDDASQVKPARLISLEAALEYIQDDELVEITPIAVRMRKKEICESMRKRTARRIQTAGVA